MSLKRPLSPESNDNLINNDNKRELKRLKLHSLIQQLRNEETKLILLKKLRINQQLITKTNKNPSTITNGFHQTPTPTPTPTPTTTIANTKINPPSIKSAPLPLNTNSHILQQQTAIRKTSNSPLLTNSTKSSTNLPYEERKNQAKLSLRKQLERDLLNIPTPKPTLQDIFFIPNGSSLEFQPFLGLEDVIQCLNELQNDRHRLPQRFTDHAQIDEPYVCEQCGTDFTIRWWKHSNSKQSNDIINILCDRCKKQIVRRTLKNEHSTLLKNVFLSAMKQEKEIEKNFSVLIKQEKASVPKSKPIVTNTQPMQTINPVTVNQKHFATKISHPQQQSAKKSNHNIVQSSHVNHPAILTHGKQHQHLQTNQHHKTIIPTHQYHHQNVHSQQQQQQIRSMHHLSQQTKHNQIGKTSKHHTIKQQTVIPTSRTVFPPNQELLNAFLSSNLVRQTTNKRRTFPNVEFK